MDNRIALSNFKHTILMALVDLKHTSDPVEWETTKIDALRVLDEVIDQNRSNQQTKEVNNV